MMARAHPSAWHADVVKWLGVLILALPGVLAEAAGPTEAAQAILAESGVRGGLIVHLGCGDGKLTAALHAHDGFLVHGLERDEASVAAARRHVRSVGQYGPVSIDRLGGSRLPYIDNLANLVVAGEETLDTQGVTVAEVMRVLCPGGVAMVMRDGQWTRTVKPRPEPIDHWTHYLYDASNNAVSGDTVVGPPRRLQWVAGPRYTRHHDHLSSFTAAVSAGGRVFYIFDEATPASILVPPKWNLIARDAFNGVVLWKRAITQWHPHLWPHKSGPAQLPRRLVAEGDRVYVTLRLDAPLTKLDAATGRTLHTYEGTRGTEEILLSDGVLFLLVNRDPEAAAPRLGPSLPERSRPRADRFWDETPRLLMAVDAETGDTLWSRPHRVVPCTLAADAQSVVFHDGECLIALDRRTGHERWRSQPAARPAELRSFFTPTLVLYEDVVLFSGGPKAGVQTGRSYIETDDAITVLSAETGEPLWTATHPPSGYRSPQDILVAGGLVWTGETMSAQATGVFTGRDPHTGKVKSRFPPNVDTYWFHHRCYRGKATENYLLMSRTGIELIDFRREDWHINHWVRGACLYGIMPANGLLYAPYHPCACYPEAKLDGFNALAPAGAGERIASEALPARRLEKGLAYDHVAGRAAAEAGAADADAWPTYRADAARSGAAKTTVPANFQPLWETDLGGRLTSPVVAGGRLFIAATDTHTVYALDATSGEVLWHFVAGGPVDSPPTIHNGTVLFGCCDGWVYCLRADNGVLAWRFLAAPIDERLVAFDRLESAWPVHGSVLVLEDVAWFTAGRSAFLDGGMRLWRVDAANGQVLSETVLDDTDAATGKQHQEFISWLNMPPALPDILSSDGRSVFMRSQRFDLDGTRPPLEPMPVGPDGRAPPATQRKEHAHLFSPTGFLDDTLWHRTYWLYGSRFVGGAPGYYLAGRAAPAGRILVFDDERVYGFGRKPQFFRWTTPMAYHLFATDRTPPPNPQPRKPDLWRENVPFAVKHHWTEDAPLYARAVVLAGRTLFLAGPENLLDERQAFQRLFDPQTQAELIRHGEALEGRKGGLLWAVSTERGAKLANLQLDAAPVFDGLVAGYGKMYLAALDGTVRCFGHTPYHSPTRAQGAAQ